MRPGLNLQQLQDKHLAEHINTWSISQCVKLIANDNSFK